MQCVFSFGIKTRYHTLKASKEIALELVQHFIKRGKLKGRDILMRICEGPKKATRGGE
jgi:hypothetical protein